MNPISHTLKIAFFPILALLVFYSCKKNNTGPSASDNILAYDIKEIPVTQDYTVGAFYYNFGTFNVNIKEVPTVGKYAMPNGVVPPTVMTQHIAQAATAGVDYFVFSFRSANKDVNNWKSDSTVVQSFVNANTTGMKFALQYNWSTGSYAASNTAPLENNATNLNLFFNDFQRAATNWMSNPNYLKVNGKTLLYIQNAQVLYSNNNQKIYDTLRSRLSAMGFTMYIVGMQDRWTPPARYPFRYIKCVDAIYHQSFSTQLSQYDRWYVLPQAMDQNWEYSRKYFTDSMGSISYVPNISPAYNWLITTPATLNPNYPRTDSGAMYQKLCNVAKMNADNATRLIMIDSWNSWQDDSQLESAVSYGDRYLNITRQEFKVKK
ncbi:MAG TPA: glycoside hydrolase family 99-like domain-containing protein [Puia sp.]|nr:glycoside hydrolase family 99-like domain-containing protein [Puia sp.]